MIGEVVGAALTDFDVKAILPTRYQVDGMAQDSHILGVGGCMVVRSNGQDDVVTMVR